jgi:RNA polymerase sigma factor (sigma-70 family)
MDAPDTKGGPREASPDVAKLSDVWNQFYAYCFAIINQCPGVRRLSTTDREDCVQDVMMEIVRKFGTYDPDATPDLLTGWIRVISRNKAADIIRRRTRKPEVLFDDGAGGAVLDLNRGDSDGTNPAGEYVSLVWEALIALDHKVSATSYLVFYLRSIEGWSIGEVAELFHMSPEQARARCHRVRKKFSSILETKGRQRGINSH